MDSEELRITAELAHLNMSDEELDTARGAFEQMLEYFQAMQDAGAVISGLESGAADKMSAAPAGFRADNSPLSESFCDEIIKRAAERDGRFIVVPNVL